MTTTTPRPRHRAAGRLTTALVLPLLLLPGIPAGELGSPALLRADDDPVQERIRTRLESAGVPARIVVEGEPLHAVSALPALYEARIYRPAWMEKGVPGPQARSLVEALAAAHREGLRPEDYHASAIRDLLDRVGRNAGGGSDPALLAELDLLLTDAFLTYADHLVGGRVDPVTLHSDWVPGRREVDLVATLQRALEGGGIRSALEGLLPPQEGYERLRAAYERHRRIADEGGWPSVPDGPELQAGDTGERVAALARRLRATEELSAARGQDVDSPVFDAAVDSAVRRFQRRHGLEDDGVVGPATLSALNVSAADRARQIRVNLERWRWLPQSLGKRHVRVNAADFDLDVVEDGEVVLSMRSIVGRSYRRTPVMSDRITYLVFSPFWHVPHSLAVQDQLPLQKKDPGYFSRMGIRVFRGWDPSARPIDPSTVDWSGITAGNFPYRLRQDPGPQNALGRVKFMFPNRFSVYLHDTPGRDLFARRARSFSSGCIRVERAADLARYLLRGDPRWTPRAVEQAMEAGSEETVRLPEPVPVHLLYWTAWAAGDTVHFRADVYDRDGAVRTALEEAPPRSGSVSPATR